MDTENSKFMSAAEMGYLLGVKGAIVRQWARLGKIPKLTLPNGRFVFDPKAVIEALKKTEGASNDQP
jgi:predicted site-specific integrase-resolvase